MTQTVNIGFLRANLSGYPLEVIIYGLRTVVITKFRRENEPCILFFRRAPSMPCKTGFHALLHLLMLSLFQ